MKLKDFILIESTRDRIHQLIEEHPPKRPSQSISYPTKGIGNIRAENRRIGNLMGVGDNPHNYTKELLPTDKLSDREKKELVKKIRLLRMLGDKKGLEQVLNHLNEKRRSYGLPQLTMQGLKNATRIIGRPGPSVQSGDVNWKQHEKDTKVKSSYEENPEGNLIKRPKSKFEEGDIVTVKGKKGRWKVAQDRGKGNYLVTGLDVSLNIMSDEEEMKLAPEDKPLPKRTNVERSFNRDVNKEYKKAGISTEKKNSSEIKTGDIVRVNIGKYKSDEHEVIRTDLDGDFKLKNIRTGDLMIINSNSVEKVSKKSKKELNMTQTSAAFEDYLKNKARRQSNSTGPTPLLTGPEGIKVRDRKTEKKALEKKIANDPEYKKYQEQAGRIGYKGSIRQYIKAKGLK